MRLFMLHSPGKNLIAGRTMNLARMMTDKVFFEDKTGTRIGPYKTRFGTDRITVFQDELSVKEGDRVIQPLPDGSEQGYTVEAVSHHAERRNIPAHFSITLAKEAAPPLPVVHAGLGARAPVKSNEENIALFIQRMTEGIDNAGFPAEQKDEARRLLRALIEHPVIEAVLQKPT
jgi:hypothetical protein